MHPNMFLAGTNDAVLCPCTQELHGQRRELDPPFAPFLMLCMSLAGENELPLYQSMS